MHRSGRDHDRPALGMEEGEMCEVTLIDAFLALLFGLLGLGGGFALGWALCFSLHALFRAWWGLIKDFRADMEKRK